MALRSSAGYCKEIFVDIDDDLLCGICQEILNDPHQCQNGHMFCKTCLLAALKYKSKCPICKTSLDKNYLCKNQYVHNFIQTRRVVCKCKSEELSKDLGCVWTGNLSERELRDCDFLYCPCPTVGCNETRISLNELDKHVTSKCLKRMKMCPFCKTHHRFDLLGIHKAQCDSRPVLCLCGMDVMFNMMVLHQNSTCCDVMVDCPIHQKYGLCVPDCHGVVKRGELESHLGENFGLILFISSANL
jgi:hypothetical protein